jgi:hypothetical protein
MHRLALRRHFDQAKLQTAFPLFYSRNPLQMLEILLYGARCVHRTTRVVLFPSHNSVTRESFSMDTTPEYKKSPRRYLWIGFLMLAVGLYMGKQSLDSFHTGKPVYLPNSLPMHAWQAAGTAVLIVLCGSFIIAAGFGWIKSRDRH